MKTVNIHEAKTNLSRLVAAVEAGEDVVLARAGKPVARIVPLDRPAPKRRFGSMKGRAATTDAFFEPLPDEELARWE
ncbi:type II toxin-antitoxin system Phd/YefM family antitoxin [Amaricoccus sp.]|uniref:type II toxin-antitoxin system Phd/YefM family antitoxin n=1 Tax=Amaricoccus sp. TaxID=1872485 RepID=UPI001B79BA36|nr:type II toxin-antitoxin system Phd/YefM family antitoxin [Amaricoccus sp.]MBP7001179.1 type II toxin-antitoxin system Phd/YefM family antitoxin [Amaricoccus sp.]